MESSPRLRETLFLNGRRALILGGLAALIWSVLAYVALPYLARRHHFQPELAGRDLVTRTSFGAPGDPINFGLVGSEADVICAFRAAAWPAANARTFATSIRIVGSVALRRPYPNAPVSHLYYDGRAEDLAFEKPEGRSPRKRHHIRLWRVLDGGAEGQPVWLGAATFDSRVGFNHYTLQVTHHIGADIDAERTFLAAELTRGGMVEARYQLEGVGETVNGRNGGGDRYFTDGEVVVLRLRQGCNAKSKDAPQVLSSGVAETVKTQVWKALRFAF
ncbi:MAG: LssY C-terminal domain-containing protein [Hyphomicrobiales bacterium]|nr:LssY C-terminal domain-containing protein [Hyphomicrobiales bacterium]